MKSGKLKSKSQSYIISLGGSLIVPYEIDVKFLRSFRNLIRRRVSKGDRFLVLCGGGRTCRLYQKAARDIANVSDEALDWIGIEANRFNAHLLRWILGAKKYEPIPTLNTFGNKLKSPITLAVGAIRPGNSSDSSAIAYARKLGLKTVLNMTNVAGVYDKDPNKFQKARLISRMTWAQFRKQFGASRKPGQHKPFDPSAARLAERLGIEVVILNGRDIKNLKRFFAGKSFKGTIIE